MVYNRSIEEIKKECVEITTRLNNNVSSTGPKDLRAANSAFATIHGIRKIIYVYTSCCLAGETSRCWKHAQGSKRKFMVHGEIFGEK